MINLIDEKVTKEQLLEEYKTYPSTMSDVDEKPFYESRLAPIYYEVRQGSKVLDVGCNDGVFMQLLKDKRSCEVWGVDISEVALEEAKKRGLNVQKADVEALPFPDATFDVITCMEVLSHLFDPGKALKEIRRVLKPNGILLGSCPHKNLESYAWDDKRLHRRYFELTDLHELLSQSFDRSFIRTLTGRQFALSLAEGFLADMPAEMLFKSGGDKTNDWDEALRDRSILRCWFGATQTPGTVYYRMTAFADKMQKMGAEVHYDPYDETDFHSAGDWCRKIRWDVVNQRLENQHIADELYTIFKAIDMSVFQVVPNRHILTLLTALRDPKNLYPQWTKKPMWVEIDDWIFDVPSYNLASGPYQPNSEMEAVAYEQIKLSDGVICSTQYLKEKLAQIFPDKPIYVVRNALDFDIWDHVTRPTKLHDENQDLVRISYTGCGNHSGDLELIAEPIAALLDEFPNLEFVSLPYPSTDFIKNPRFKRVDKWVALSIYPQTIANWEMDIGIAPLRDNELNRAKSNLRWLEYSALNVPTLASRVYPFSQSIVNNHDGLLVGNSKKEWYEALKSLIVDKEKRKRLGEAAYRRVKHEFNLDDVASSYLSILKNIKREFLNAIERPTSRDRSAA